MPFCVGGWAEYEKWYGECEVDHRCLCCGVYVCACGCSAEEIDEWFEEYGRAAQ